LADAALRAERRVTPLRFQRGDVLVAALAALAAFALKRFYAQASASELGFVLAPTSALVALATGAAFEAEAGAGYVSRELRFVIAPVCAGLNYTIAAFATLVLGFAPRTSGTPRKLAWLLAAAGTALAATIVVNAARISLAIALRGAALPAWLSPEMLHRVEGVAVYLVSLWLLWAAVAHAFATRAPSWLGILLPLALYLAVALLVPLLNGPDASYWPHARAVAWTALALTSAALTLRAAARRRARRPARHP
jgi:exosortase K